MATVDYKKGKNHPSTELCILRSGDGAFQVLSGENYLPPRAVETVIKGLDIRLLLTYNRVII